MRSKLGRGRESYGSDESGEEERVERLMKAKGGEPAEREGRCGLWLGCNNCVCVWCILKFQWLRKRRDVLLVMMTRKKRTELIMSRPRPHHI